jgi:hypothetical protein
MIRTFIIFFLIFLPFFGKTQTVSEKPAEKERRFSNFLSTYDYRMAVQNTGIGMPPNFVNGKLHPGFLVGFQKNIKPHSRWDYHVDFGYFAIHSLQRTAYLKPGIGYAIPIAKTFELRPFLNLGFMGVGQINDEFKFVNGQYEKGARHRLQIAPGFGLESFFTVVKKKNREFQAMLAYEFGTQLPFSSLSSILPLNQIKVGVRIKK